MTGEQGEYRICWRDPDGTANSGSAFRAERAAAEDVIARLNLKFPRYWLERVDGSGGDQ